MLYVICYIYSNIRKDRREKVEKEDTKLEGGGKRELEKNEGNESSNK